MSIQSYRAVIRRQLLSRLMFLYILIYLLQQNLCRFITYSTILLSGSLNLIPHEYRALLMVQQHPAESITDKEFPHLLSENSASAPQFEHRPYSFLP
jgi:hypothetical protein